MLLVLQSIFHFPSLDAQLIHGLRSAHNVCHPRGSGDPVDSATEVYNSALILLKFKVELTFITMEMALVLHVLTG